MCFFFFFTYIKRVSFGLQTHLWRTLGPTYDAAWFVRLHCSASLSRLSFAVSGHRSSITPWCSSTSFASPTTSIKKPSRQKKKKSMWLA
uniref:Putative secreted protein n=1 Tax=Ixodes ricinus TaxID=34613 RepID=A0A6B0U9S1_IXORI